MPSASDRSSPPWVAGGARHRDSAGDGFARSDVDIAVGVLLARHGSTVGHAHGALLATPADDAARRLWESPVPDLRGDPATWVT